MKISCLILIILLFQYFGFAQNKTVDSLLTVLKTQREDTNKVNTLNSISINFDKIGDFSLGLKYGQSALELSKKIKFLRGIAKAYNSIGNNFSGQSNHVQALESYFNSIKVREILGDNNAVSMGYFNIGVTYLNQSNYDEALTYFNKSLNIFSDLGDQKKMSYCYNNIGYIYDRQSNYTKALEYCTKSLKISEELDDKDAISAGFINLGRFYEKQNNDPKALEYYSKAYKLKEELGDKKGLSVCCLNIGNIYGFQKNYKEALNYFRKSLKLSEEIGEKYEIAKCYNNIGNIFSNQSNYQQALEYLNISLKIFGEIENKDWVAICLSDLCNLNNILKKYSLAKQQANQAISISKEINGLDIMRNSYEQLAIAEEGLGNYKAAYLNHKKFKLLTDSTFNSENSKQMSDIKTKFEVEKKETELKTANKIEQAKKDAQIAKQKLQRNVFIIGLILMLAITLLIFRSYRQKRQANIIITKQKDEVEQQKNIVEFQNKEILSSIEYAKRIQATILPPPKVVKKYLDDSFVFYLPKDIVAGDFYWMEQAFSNVFNREEIVLFAACDCTGHGVPGALVSVVCSNALNRAVKEYNLTQPSLILDKVSELVIKDFSKDESEDVKDGMDASLCALNIETGQLQWAGANNSLWLVRNGLLMETKADKQPIGKTDNLQPFSNHEIKLQKGDTLYLFTDGYADQFGGEKDRKYSKKSFKELVISINHLSMLEQRETLYNNHIHWRGMNEQVDDICIIGVRI